VAKRRAVRLNPLQIDVEREEAVERWRGGEVETVKDMV
jgi:hypothetical protein